MAIKFKQGSPQPLAFTQSKDNLKFQQSNGSLTLQPNNNKMELAADDKYLIFGNSDDEVFIGAEPPKKESIELWVDLNATGSSGSTTNNIFIGEEEPPADDYVVWIDTDEESGSGSSSIKIDSALSLTSKNPVQNKVITKALNERIEEEQYLTNTELEALLGGK